MCGRFTLRAPASLIAEQFALFEGFDWEPRYNIAPTQPVLAVRATGEPGGRQAVRLRWGLIPSWATDPSIGNRMINARAETVAEKPAYRGALRHRRCLIVADGFYEWQKIGKRKQPHFFRFADDRPFAFAGLWETWEGPDHSAIESCALVTTEANELVRPVHDRMPVILPPQEYDVWLDPAVERGDRLTSLLRPHDPAVMTAAAVSLHVNSPANDDRLCIAPAAD